MSQHFIYKRAQLFVVLTIALYFMNNLTPFVKHSTRSTHSEKKPDLGFS